MSKLIDIAKNTLESFDEAGFDAFGMKWDSEEINALLRYDVIKVMSVVFVLSDMDRRRVICDGITDIFCTQDPSLMMMRVINEKINEKNLLNELYHLLPDSISLAYGIDDQEEKRVVVSAMYFAVMIVCRAIMYPDYGKDTDRDVSSFIISSYLECCKKRIQSQGLLSDRWDLDLFPSVSDFGDCTSIAVERHLIDGWEKELYYGIIDTVDELIKKNDITYRVEACVEAGVGLIRRTDSFRENIIFLKQCMDQKKKDKPNDPLETTVRQLTPEELMLDFISSSKYIKGEMNELLGMYEKLSPTMKNTRNKIYRVWFWDYWVLHDCDISYEELSERVINNKWYVSEQIAIQNKDFKLAIPYFQSLQKVTEGVVSKRIDKNVICDCIVLVFNCLSRVFGQYGIDISDLILGEFIEEDWIPFGDEYDIRNNCENDLNVNVGDLLLFCYDGKIKKGLVSHHSNGLEANLFTTHILKCIDNGFRSLCKYKNHLNTDFDATSRGEKRFIYGFNEIDRVVTLVTRICYNINTPVYSSDCSCCGPISIKKDYSRKYVFVGNTPCQTDEIVREEIDKYYERLAGIDLETMKDSAFSRLNGEEIRKQYDVVEIDIDNINIEDWKAKIKDRKSFKYSFVEMSLNSFYDNYEEYYDRFMDSRSDDVEYDPSYDFLKTDIMKERDGLFGKDVSTLLYLTKYPDAFSQLLCWLENGKLVLPKNERYVQVLYYYLINERVLRRKHRAVLVIMTQIWNHYVETADELNKDFLLYYEWIKDYWMINCKEIDYDAFKALFCVDMVFESGILDYEPIGKKEYNKYKANNNLIGFYNECCGGVVEKGLVSKYPECRDLIELSLVRVHEKLSELWSKNGLEFYDYLLYSENKYVSLKREVYFRAIISHWTKHRIRREFNKPLFLDGLKYDIEVDDATGRLCFKLSKFVPDDLPRRKLLLFIYKYIETAIVKWLLFPYHCKPIGEMLYETFPDQLFVDDYLGDSCVRKAIINTTIDACIHRGGHYGDYFDFLDDLEEDDFIIDDWDDGLSKSISDSEEIDLQKRYSGDLELSDDTIIVPGRPKKDLATENEEDLKVKVLNQILRFNKWKNTKIKSDKNVTKSVDSEYDLIDRQQIVDSNTIEEARKVLIKNQNRLVVEESDLTNATREDTDPSKDLTNDEKAFLRALLDGEGYQKLVSEYEKRHISVNILIDSINDKAVDLIGDIIIDDDSYELIDDYLDEITGLIEA